MPRWLTFDSRTASRLRRQLKGDQVFEHGASGAVDYAVNIHTSTVAVIPTEVPGQAAVAVIRPVALPRAAALPAQKKPASYPVISAAKSSSLKKSGTISSFNLGWLSW